MSVSFVKILNELQVSRGCLSCSACLHPLKRYVPVKSVDPTPMIKDLSRYLSYLNEIGFEYLPISKDHKIYLHKPETVTKKKGGRRLKPDLKAIREELGDCKRCKLYKERTNIVFGVGNPRAEVIFVGEGPGREEDIKGEPFVGRAGQLLTRIIMAMGLKRNEVYICNVVKCRPPNNRNPQHEEIAACRPFLEKQIDAIMPRVIVALGNHAAQTLMNTQERISELRGRFNWYRDGIKIMPTYHPAYLLRNEGKKKETWADMKLVMEELKLSCKGTD